MYCAAGVNKPIAMPAVYRYDLDSYTLPAVYRCDMDSYAQHIALDNDQLCVGFFAVLVIKLSVLHWSSGSTTRTIPRVPLFWVCFSEGLTQLA
jgi:hypothetical protein